MKNATLLFLFIFISISQLKSQEIGNIFLGGTFNYSTNSIDASMSNTTNTELTVHPMIGIMLSERAAVGLEVGYETDKTVSTGI